DAVWRRRYSGFRHSESLRQQMTKSRGSAGGGAGEREQQRIVRRRRLAKAGDLLEQQVRPGGGVIGRGDQRRGQAAEGCQAKLLSGGVSGFAGTVGVGEEAGARREGKRRGVAGEFVGCVGAEERAGGVE